VQFTHLEQMGSSSALVTVVPGATQFDTGLDPAATEAAAAVARRERIILCGPANVESSWWIV
jgi:hypothetical protein